MIHLLLLSIFPSAKTQPILPPFGYPGYGSYGGGGYGGYGYPPAFGGPLGYPQYPYGLTHFGTQSTYQLPFSPFGPFFGGYQGYQGQLQTPLSYDVNGAAAPVVQEQAGFLSLVNDKDNFQVQYKLSKPQGCGWDAVQMRCTDGLGICKGGCRDFATTTSLTAHDCRCIPYGYAALLQFMG